MARRRSSTDRPRSSVSAISRISKTSFSISAGRRRRARPSRRWCGGRTARSRSPRACSSSAMRAYSICCAGGQLEHDRHQQPLLLHPAGGLLPQHLLEQDALVRHVLVDDPEAVAAGGDDEALVDLAQRRAGRDSAARLAGASCSASAGNPPCVSGTRKRSGWTESRSAGSRLRRNRSAAAAPAPVAG